MQPNIRLLAIAFLLTGFVLTLSSVMAGDEVDYSAPYMTLENGKLVTKYPDKKHQADGNAADPLDGSSGVGRDGSLFSPVNEQIPGNDSASRFWLIGIALLIVTGLFAGVRIRRRREQP